MTNNINTAYRLREIFERAINIPNQGKVIDRWGDVFGIEKSNRFDIHVIECLGLLRSEVELFKNKLINHEKKISQERINKIINLSLEIISTDHIFSGWQSFVGNITESLIDSLDLLSELMPCDETIISNEELQELLESIKKFKKKISDSLLTDEVKMFVLTYIKKIEFAILSYKIRGAVVFKDVILNSVGELLIYKEVLIKNKNSDEVKEFGSMWSKINNFANHSESIGKIIEPFKKFAILLKALD